MQYYGGLVSGNEEAVDQEPIYVVCTVCVGC